MAGKGNILLIIVLFPLQFVQIQRFSNCGIWQFCRCADIGHPSRSAYSIYTKHCGTCEKQESVKTLTSRKVTPLHSTIIMTIIPLHVQNQTSCLFFFLRLGPVRIRHSSHDFGWQSSHSVDLAGWQAKMASIEIWIPWRNALKPHYLSQSRKFQLIRALRRNFTLGPRLSVWSIQWFTE